MLAAGIAILVALGLICTTKWYRNLDFKAERKFDSYVGEPLSYVGLLLSAAGIIVWLWENAP